MKVITILLFLTFYLDLFSQQNPIRLIFSSHSTCDGSEDTERIRQRIISQSFAKDTLLISLGIVTECDLIDPMIKISKSNDTLDIIIKRKLIPVYDSIAKDTICDFQVVECDCCYQFDLKITGLDHKDYYIRVNKNHVVLSNEKYLTYPVRYELTPNGDTINYVDKYGLMQGLWIKKNSNGIIKHMFCKDSKLLRYKIYYSNGQLKCDCFVRPGHFDGFDEVINETGNCKHWDENGKEVTK